MVGSEGRQYYRKKRDALLRTYMGKAKMQAGGQQRVLLLSYLALWDVENSISIERGR